MWTEYAVKYIKNNKGSSLFLAAISYIAASLLGLISSMAYNVWKDHIAQIIQKEGSYTPGPEPLAMAYGFVVVTAGISLIFMIHNAFAVPMNNRIHQLGILQSVGATPRQIRFFLIQEMMILCALPLILGVASGMTGSYFLFQIAERSTANIRTYETQFYFHIGVVILSLLISGLTVFISAWIPAVKLSKLMPLTALSYGVEADTRKMRRFSLFQVFGIYGTLARKSLYARKKELRTSTLALTFAFLALMGLLNIEAISTISTQYTYFARFRDKYDMVLTTKQNELLEQIKETKGVRSCIAYQKYFTDTEIAEDALSEELRKAGIQNLDSSLGVNQKSMIPMQVPVYILDDYSFAAYCRDHGIETEKPVAINIIWDSVNSSRKNRTYLPLIDVTRPLLIDIDGNTLSIDTFAEQMPQMKEEYQQYSLTLIMSASYSQKLGNKPFIRDTTYNILLTSNEYDEMVQEKIRDYLGGETDYELTSRAGEEASEHEIKQILRIFIYCFTGIIVLIGITNIFSFTLGQIYQRRKEFTRYFSVGMPPGKMKYIFTMEAAVICFRPLLISILINIPLVGMALSAAEITLPEFLSEAPILPVCLFTCISFLLIALAYYLGGRKICNCDFVEALKDETML